MTLKKNPNATIDDRDAYGRLQYVQCPACNALMTDIRKTHFTSGRCVIATKEEFLEKYPTANLKSEAARANGAVSLENMIKKHGEVAGRQKWDEYCQRQSYAGCTLEYFIGILGEHEGAKKYKEVCAQKGITLENMLRVHGDDGEQIYYQWLTASRYDSPKANKFIAALMDKLATLPNLKYHSSENGGEFCIYKDRPFLYDLVITAPVQVCIEFHGDFWHANPQTYKAEDVVPLRGEHKKAKDIWAHDALKETLITDRGYMYFQVWESEYDSEPDTVVEEIFKWILQLQQS